MDQNDLFEKVNSINSIGKSKKKVDECRECATRGNCQGRGAKCNDYVKDDINPDDVRNDEDETIIIDASYLSDDINDDGLEETLKKFSFEDIQPEELARAYVTAQEAVEKLYTLIDMESTDDPRAKGGLGPDDSDDDKNDLPGYAR